MMKKWIQRSALLVMLIFAVLQILPRNKPENKEVGEMDIILFEKPPMEISKILKAACYDCHSNQSVHPWYSDIAPVSWWLDDHIEDARKHLNLSEWGNYSAEKKAHKGEEGVEEIEEGEMPLFSYQIAHSEARLSQEEQELLMNWFASIEKKYKR